MMFIDRAPKPGFQNVRVNLRCGDVGVTEHCLDAA
jgi:hypothetical protein